MGTLDSRPGATTLTRVRVHTENHKEHLRHALQGQNDPIQPFRFRLRGNPEPDRPISGKVQRTPARFAMLRCPQMWAMAGWIDGGRQYAEAVLRGIPVAAIAVGGCLR